MTTNIEQKANATLAQIYNACYYSRSDERNVQKLLEKTADINYKIPATSHNQTDKAKSVGNTALHFAYYTEKIRIFDFLLSRSADYTSQNSKGSTVLHEALYSYHFYSNSRKFVRQLECTEINSILATHVKNKNFTNPLDENGISHFHGACMANNVDAVELFLNNGVNVDHAVKMDSPYFAGYSPLHFAVRCGSLKAARILLQRGANVSLKDAKGMTALQLLIEQSVKMVDWIQTGKDMFHKRVPGDLKVNEEMIDAFIEYNHGSTNPDAVDAGMSYFHVACTTENTDLAESLLKNVKDINSFVSMDSPVCPGYTAAHFAALFNMNTLKLLLQKGANVELKDTNGVTPFDMCLERYDPPDIHFILSSQPSWKSILVSDNKTNLLDLVLSMRDPQTFEAYLDTTRLDVNTFVIDDSPIWAKYTLLHLAVTLSEKFKQRSNYSPHLCLPVRFFKPNLEVIKKCLDQGSNFTAQDCHGRTPLHLAFRQCKVKTVDLLLQHHKELTNVIDEDNLSHLHVACAAKNVSSVERLLSNDVHVNCPLKSSFKWYSGQLYRTQAGDSPDVTISSGSTPLHIAVAVESPELVGLLLKHGADQYAKDDNGKTPIHLVIDLRKPNLVVNMFLSSPDLKDVVSSHGISHLHVAVTVNDASAVENLLDQGANVNLVHNDPQTYYAGYTPLGISIEKNCSDVVGLLIRRGADIFAKNPKESTSIVYKFFSFPNGWYLDHFLDRLKSDEFARKFLEEDSGVTMLHIACLVGDVDAVTSLLKDGVDVNARAHEDSKLWPGSTPLHVLMMPSRRSKVDDVKVMMRLLLDHGADVTVADAQGRTPVDLPTRDLELALLLLKHYKNFNLNHKSAGSSLPFHLACLANDTSMVEEFLKLGAAVNEPVDYFSSHYAGCTPLHLALNHGSTDISFRLATIDCLLKNGADVNAEDALGNTSLHIAANCKSNRLDLMEKLYSAGANITAIDIFGKTPFEVLLCSENNCTIQEINFFLKNGCHLNEFNPINQMGYVARIFSRQSQSILQERTLEVMENSTDHIKSDDRGRTIVHNVVSILAFMSDCSEERYVEVIKKLTIFGCDIDDQDKLGKTALHAAASFGNLPAVCGLLKLGANANITDVNGETAFSDAMETYNRSEGADRYEHMEVVKIFLTYLRFLEICKTPINEANVAIQKKELENFSVDAEKISCFQEQMEKTRVTKVGAMNLSSFLMEREAVDVYVDAPQSERCAIDAFFQAIDEREFDVVKCILNLNYRKAVAKTKVMV